MPEVDLWTPGKTFFYGIGTGCLIMYFVPRYIEGRLEKMGDSIAQKIRATPNPALNPGCNSGGCGEVDIITLYNRMITTQEKLVSTLDRIDSRLGRLESAYNR